MTPAPGPTGLERWSPLITLTVVLIDAVLLATGLVTVRGALVLVLVVEVPLLILTLTVLATAVRRQMRSGLALVPAIRTVLGRSPVAPFARAEIRTYVSLVRWILRRPAVPRGATAVPATEGMLAVPVVFSIATVIELFVLDVILPWWWVRVLVIIASLWSLAMLWGVVSFRAAYPHVLTQEHLVLRQSGELVARIERSRIEQVARRRRFSPTEPAFEGERLAVPGPNGTDVDITLAAPITARIPGIFGRVGTSGDVEVISLHLDDPTALLAAFSASDQPR